MEVFGTVVPGTSGRYAAVGDGVPGAGSKEQNTVPPCVTAMTPSRREVLIVGTVGLTGCLDTGESDSGDGATPEEEEGDDGSTARLEGGETVSFPVHGAERVGTVFGSGSCGVVFSHGAVFDKESWYPQARAVAERGHVAFPIDLEEFSAAEVMSAVEYLRSERDVDRIVLVGASAGGPPVLEASATVEEPIRGTVALAAAGGSEYASQLRGRSLFVVAEGDSGSRNRTESMHEDAPDPTALELIDGDAHAQHIFDTEHGDDLLALLLEFVDEVCARA